MRIQNAIGELKISYKTVAKPMGKVLRSLDGYEFLRSVWDYDLMEYQEQFCLVCMSRSQHIIGYEFISTGGSAGTVVDPKMVFQAALLCNASCIMLAHNHPSGNLQPSDQDQRLTERLKRVGKDLDIPVIDHIIITKDSYTSFADQGIL
jgi:DNA repair protein RadC